jgi:hypothetical protein
MATNVFPALNVQPLQQADPIGQLGKVMALKTMMQQQQYQQQMQPLELQKTQQEVQQQQMAIAQQKAMLDAAPQFVQHDANGKPTGFDSAGYFNSLQGKVSPSTLFAEQKSIADSTLATANAGAAQLKLQKDKNDNAYQIFEGVRQTAKDNPQAAQQVYQNAIPKLQDLGVDTSKYPTDFTQVGDKGLQQFEVQLGVHGQMLADAETIAKTQKDAADTALTNIKVNLSQNSRPGDFDAVIDQATNNPLTRAMGPVYKNEVNLALSKGDYEGAQGIVKQMGEYVGGMRKEQYTQQQESVRQNLNRQAMTADRLQTQGISALDTIWTNPQHGYGQFLSQAQMTKNAIADSKNGNELASSLMPVMTAQGVSSFAGVKRIPPSEVAAAGPQLGSAYRRINAILDKVGTGSVPADTLNEVNGLVDQMIATRHNQALQSSRQIAANTGLDLDKTSVMDPQGNVVPLSRAGATPAPAPTPTPGAMPPGATMRVPGSDGKMHWSDGKNDLGVVQ